MANRRVRLAAIAVLAFALWQVPGFDAQAQRYKTQNPQPSGNRDPQPAPQPVADRYQDTSTTDGTSLQVPDTTPTPPNDGAQQPTADSTGSNNATNKTSKSPNSSRQQTRRVMPQKAMAKQSKSQPIRMAAKTQAAGKSKSQNNPQAKKEPTSIEQLDPEKRAAFLKLIGANWIWSPAFPKDNVPVGDVYFRKTFQINQAEFGQVHVACDNQYELYINGQLVGHGADWRRMDVHDVNKLLVHGTNVVAIKATNTDAGPAGLVARVVVKERGGTYESFSTDATWRTSVKAPANWMQVKLRDTDWLPAKVYGPLGGVLPWGDEITIADEGSRFVTDPEFAVERIVTDQQAGSLIAMTFNASGDILASREGGGILLIRDKDKDGTFETVETFCSEVKNVQGILSLGNRVYAVGDGPAGGALYQIIDSNGDGRSDSVKALVKFRGIIGEHGPHKVHLGPDGMLYLLSGNFAQVAATIDPRSPYVTPYEGDLVQPRYEDPQGHAAGVTAPGGTILRTDVNAGSVEMVAGGFRNCYDFAFSSDGELFTADSDMEWDIGSPWYRPTRIIHSTPGGEFGWRSGWAPWPAYYLDSLPATADTGPGSPTGVVYYDHTAYPERLQNTLFVGDWASGQINAVKLERDGATYKAKVTPFLKGRPLNVTALDVGPDGAIYFATGGRGTDGGIYRVSWTGAALPHAIRFGQGIEQALEQPELGSDWARARVAKVKANLGSRWQTELERVLTSNRSTPHDRLRAIDLMTFFGPTPTAELLTQLVRDKDPAIRVRAIRLMGARLNTEFTQPLVAVLSDRDPWVRRTACEAIAHRGTGAPVSVLVGLLADEDRFVAFAARRVLEKMPAKDWQEQVLTAATRPFLQGSTGLLVANPSPELAHKILARCEAMLRGDVNDPGQKRGDLSDANYLDLLRVVQLALIRGKVASADVPTLSQQLLREYPAHDAMMNRELVKLLAYLQPAGAAHALAKQLDTDIPDVEKLQVAAYVPRIASGWESADKLTMLRYLEKVRGIEGGHSLAGYIEFFARDFFANLTLAERKQLIATGENYPTSALSILAKLPENPGPEVLAEVRALDKRTDGMTGEPIARLRVGTVAVLGSSGESESLAYLRTVYLHQPERRATVAMSLTQHPDGDNWPILVDSLRTVDGDAAREILGALVHADRRPDKSEPYRNAILLGLRLETDGGELVARLLEKWVGQTPYKSDASLADQLAGWQKWYATTFPNERPAELPKETKQNKWSYDELLSYLETSDGKSGSPSRGAQVFHDVQCINCHRFNGKGESIGPDLSTVSQRFTKKEILESILFPSQVVSDQYASKIVISNGKTYTGIAARNPDGSMTILQSDGKKIQLAASDIDDVQTSKVSAMPEGLANRLTLQQIGDLFAFLMKSPEPKLAGREPSTKRR